jgi:hypothetical protein
MLLFQTLSARDGSWSDRRHAACSMHQQRMMKQLLVCRAYPQGSKRGTLACPDRGG